MKKITKVEFVFENIEHVNIPIEWFVHFDFKRSAGGEFGLLEMWDLKFELKREINGFAQSLDCDLHAVEYGGKTLFERISHYSDICRVRLFYSDGSTEEHAVNWEDEEYSEFRNILQNSMITEDGNLLVEIKRS